MIRQVPKLKKCCGVDPVVISRCYGLDVRPVIKCPVCGKESITKEMWWLIVESWNKGEFETYQTTLF